MNGISRRELIKCTASVAAAVSVSHVLPAESQARSNADRSKPNVLLIMTDQQRKDSIGAYGNPVIKTPHLDSLAAGGVRFENCYVQHAACMPSRACIFTGRYPMAHRVRSNGVPLPKHETTLAHVFARNGYRTGGAGKFHFLPHYPYRSPLPMMRTHPEPYYGFQEFHLGEDGRSGEHWVWIKENHPQYHKTPDHQIPLELHNTFWSASHTIDFIRKCAGRGEPFFAFCSFVDPHHGYNPPPPYRDMYKAEDMPEPVRKADEFNDKPPHLKARVKRLEGVSKNVAYNRTQYYGEVTFIDDAIGRILKVLDELKIRDDTLIVFMSDHGDMLGDHRLYFKGLAYPQSANVPLIFNWPGHLRKGKVVNGMMQEIDVFPTIMDLVGMGCPPGVQGRSQAKVLTTDSENTGYDYVYTEHASSDYSLRSPKWRFTYYPGKDYGELYDLQRDPHEFVNLWDQEKPADVKRELTTILLDRIVSTRDPLPIKKKPY
jgi:arylsulfatase A-like enzyme